MDLNSLIVSIAFLLIACSSRTDETIEGYKPHETLVVTLSFKANQEIEKVVLQANGNKDSISTAEIANKTSVKLKCPQRGEGTYSLCVYRKKDTLCSKEGYVEGGYRPKLELTDNEIKVVE